MLWSQLSLRKQKLPPLGLAPSYTYDYHNIHRLASRIERPNFDFQDLLSVHGFSHNLQQQFTAG